VQKSQRMEVFYYFLWPLPMYKEAGFFYNNSYSPKPSNFNNQRSTRDTPVFFQPQCQCVYVLLFIVRQI